MEVEAVPWEKKKKKTISSASDYSANRDCQLPCLLEGSGTVGQASFCSFSNLRATWRLPSDCLFLLSKRMCSKSLRVGSTSSYTQTSHFRSLELNLGTPYSMSKLHVRRTNAAGPSGTHLWALRPRCSVYPEIQCRANWHDLGAAQATTKMHKISLVGKSNQKGRSSSKCHVGAKTERWGSHGESRESGVTASLSSCLPCKAPKMVRFVYP